MNDSKSKPMLAVSGLNAWYGAAQILRDVAFDVRYGEVVALMGRNGAGKTTTMKAVMGLGVRRTGAITFNGFDIAPLPAHEIAQRGLGFMPEDRRIFTDLTVAENLDIGRQPPRPSAPVWTPERLYTLFPNLADMTDRLGGRMSGGEQKMLSVARTLMGNPYLVMLDEPSEGVAPLIAERMADTILALKRQGLSILLSEQNLNFARLVSDRAYVLERGEVRWSGTMAALDADTQAQRAFLTI